MTECFVIWSNVMHPSHETGMYMKPAGISRNEQFSKFKQHSGTYGVVRHIKDFSGMPFEYRKFTLNRLQMILAHSKRISSWTQLKCNWNPVGIFRMLSQCPCIDVSVELLRRTWWTVVHSQQKSLAVNICVLPLSGSWSYRAIDWTVSVVGVFLWRARRLGIRCQSSWPRTESWYFQTSAEDIHFYEILMTKCIQRIRDLFEYALYKFTLYLLTYPGMHSSAVQLQFDHC